MAQLKNGTSMGGYLAYHSGNFTTSTYVSTTYNSSLNTDSRNSRGVTRLYRNDSDSDYSVQVHYDGRWYLRGYNGDTYHTECKVDYAVVAASSVTATNFNNGNCYSSAGAVYVDVLNSVGASDWLELVYNSGLGVKVGTGVNGSLPLYAGSLYDSGNRVITTSSIGSQSVSYASTAGSAPANGGTSSYISINYNNDSNSTYQVLWGSSTSVYGTAGVYIQPYTDYLYATNFQLTSDISLKDNIIPIPLNPINVDYKQFVMKSNPDQIRYGVIAQDLQVNHPELVSVGSEGLLSVSYTDLLVREVAYLKEKIKEIERRIDNGFSTR